MDFNDVFFFLFKKILIICICLLFEFWIFILEIWYIFEIDFLLLFN